MSEPNPELSLDILRLNAVDYCGWMACLIIDHMEAIHPCGSDLEITYALIHRLSVEAADCIIYPAVQDEERSKALAEVIAQGAVKEARAHAAKVYGA